jgi:uncharacterized protein
MVPFFSPSPIEFTHAPNSVTLTLKNGTSAHKTVALDEFVKEITPECKLNPMAFNGHLQTNWNAGDTHVHYKRHVFQSDDKLYPGQFAVDFVIHPKTLEPRDKTLPPRTHDFSEAEWKAFCAPDENDDKPMLIIMHGLAGGSQEEYIRHMLVPLTQGGKTGWEACVINGRGCAWSKITTPYLFNARATWDMHQFVKFLRKTFPKRKFFGIGYSLGANIITNYLGEVGEACELSAAIIVGNPWDLTVANGLLRGSWIGLNIYQAGMGTSMRKLFERHADILEKAPNLDVETVRKGKFLYQWDRNVQCPTWGYPDEGAYYRDASSVDVAWNIKIPCLALHSKDDPIIHDIAVPYEMFRTNPYWVMVTTAHGGHMGWYEYSGGRWSTTAVVGFLHKFVDQTNGLNKEDIPVVVQAKKRSTDAAGHASKWDPLRRRTELSQ